MIDPRVTGYPGDNGTMVAGGVRPPETTGRQIVVFADADDDTRIDLSGAGIANVADSRDFSDGEIAADVLQSADATVFAELGIAVVAADAAQLGALQAGITSGRRVLSVSPELIHHVLQESVLEYAQAYRDGVSDLVDHLMHTNGHGTALLAADPTRPTFADTPQATWGMQAVQAISSPRSGKGVRVAVLDTGFDTSHPDFAGRTVTTQSFVAGEPPQDGHGHGTHCIGTSCGPRSPSTGPRYGIAYEADIFAGKVLSNAGSGSDAQILAGINWAVTNRCHVLSMSLGADVMQAHPPYSAAGARALRRGSLIIAAAGENPRRPARHPGFPGAPANSPGGLAVGALEQALQMAFFPAPEPARAPGTGRRSGSSPGRSLRRSTPSGASR